MTKPVPKNLSRTVFFLTVYSIIEATLMGSSIGLVIFQSRQFLYIVQDHNQYQHSQDQGNIMWNDNGDHQKPPLLSNFFSAVFPLIGGYGTATLSSTVILYREWIPKIISPRTAILLSQSMFLVYWIVLVAIQQVQENLLDQTNRLSLMSPSELNSMATPLIPLSVIWFVAVILLGLTIGLFTAGASTMEWYFEDESKAEQIEQGSEKEEKTEEKKDDEEKKKEKEESGKIMMMSVTDTETGNVIEKFKITFSAGQKAILMTLIIALFVAELRLYRWIISSQESETIIVGGAVAVSTRLMAFSLVSGTMMFFIGVRYLPRTRHVEI